MSAIEIMLSNQALSNLQQKIYFQLQKDKV